MRRMLTTQHTWIGHRCVFLWKRHFFHQIFLFFSTFFYMCLSFLSNRIKFVDFFCFRDDDIHKCKFHINLYNTCIIISYIRCKWLENKSYLKKIKTKNDENHSASMQYFPLLSEKCNEKNPGNVLTTIACKLQIDFGLIEKQIVRSSHCLPLSSSFNHWALSSLSTTTPHHFI